MDLTGFFPYRMAVTAEGLSRRLAGVYSRAYGLSREEWRLLFLLSDAERIDSQTLAKRTTLDKVQVTRASQRLEAKGLLLREIPARDKRLREFEITPEGLALFRELAPKVRAEAEEIFASMAPEDRAALDQGLSALSAAIAARGKGEVLPERED